MSPALHDTWKEVEAVSSSDIKTMIVQQLELKSRMNFKAHPQTTPQRIRTRIDEARNAATNSADGGGGRTIKGCWLGPPGTSSELSGGFEGGIVSSAYFAHWASSVIIIVVESNPTTSTRGTAMPLGARGGGFGREGGRGFKETCSNANRAPYRLCSML
jgi:hypothetical protein